MAKALFHIIFLGWYLVVGVHSLDICEGQEDGERLAHPKDCSRFIECHQGETVAIRYCPFGLHFNRYESICDFKFRAGCDFSYALQLVSYNSADEIDCRACRFKCSNVANEQQPVRLIDSGNYQNLKGSKLLAPIAKLTTACYTEQSKPTTSTQSSTKPATPTPCSSNPLKPSTTIITTDSTLCATSSSTPTSSTESTMSSTKQLSTTSTLCSTTLTHSSSIITTESSTPNIPTAPTPCPTKSSTQTVILTKPTTTITTPCSSKRSTPTVTTTPCKNNTHPPSSPPLFSKCCDTPGKCAGKKDGALLPDDSSSGYIVCDGQCEIKMSCTANLVFNAVLQVCDWPQS